MSHSYNVFNYTKLLDNDSEFHIAMGKGLPLHSNSDQIDFNMQQHHRVDSFPP